MTYQATNQEKAMLLYDEDAIADYETRIEALTQEHLSWLKEA